MQAAFTDLKKMSKCRSRKK